MVTENGAKNNDMERLRELESKLEIYKSTLTEIYDQYDQKLEELSLVRRIGDALRSAISMESLSSALLGTVAREAAVDRLVLMVTDDQAKNLQLAIRAAYWSDSEKLTFHDHDQAQPWRLEALGDQIPEGALNAPLILTDVSSAYDPLGLPEEGHRSLVFLPLTVRRRLLGLLVLSRPAHSPFAKEDERLLSIMADQAGAALSNVLLFDDLNRVNLRLTKSERRAREVSNYLQRLLESANDAIFTVNQKGLITYSNQKAGQWGWPREELAGREFRLFLENAPSLAAWPPGGPPPADKVFEAVLINAAGQRRELLLSTSSVGGEGQGLSDPALGLGDAGPAWMILAGDITERNQLERQLIHSEKLASIGLLAAGVAHEVGNPLSAISGYAQILEYGGVGEAEEKEYLGAIISQTGRIQKILKELLDYSRPSKGLTETIDLAEALPRIINMLTSQRVFQKTEVFYNFDMNSGPYLVVIDRDHLAQVVIIIAMNAAQAMEQGGRFTITLTNDDSGVHLIMEDTGPGIEPHIVVRIFDPFFTTKSPGEGSGLGLAICQRIVDSYQGRISLTSQKGEGARFDITWPQAVNN